MTSSFLTTFHAKETRTPGPGKRGRPTHTMSRRTLDPSASDPVKGALIRVSSEVENSSECSKRPRIDVVTAELSSCLTSISEDPQTSNQCYATDTFEIGDLAADFPSVSGIQTDEVGVLPILDSLLVDMPSVCTVEQASEVSSEENYTGDGHLQSSSEHELMGARQLQEPDPKSKKLCSQGGEESQEKRIADRAARNRESSRRAREKAKLRLRSLEDDKRSLLEMIHHLKMQNEDLYAQLSARTLQQTCSKCSYNANSRSGMSCGLPHAPLRLRRCAADPRRPHAQLDRNYRTTL